MLFTSPLPSVTNVTPSRTPFPLERDVLYGRPLGCRLLGGYNSTEQMHSHVVVGQLLVHVADLPLPSRSIAGYINSSKNRGYPDPGIFLLKLNSLTRYRCDERSMTKTS